MLTKRVFNGDDWKDEKRPALNQMRKARLPLKRDFFERYPIYKSKAGLAFCIALSPRPGRADLVFFTETEFEWIKRMDTSPDEFRVYWYQKQDDFRFTPIPDSHRAKMRETAKEMSGAILANLKSARDAKSDDFKEKSFRQTHPQI